MSSINLDILDGLTDDDIEIICRNADLNMMLEPIKQNGRHYARYVSRLGRLDKKSMLVQKNLPRIAFELYKKGDVNFNKFFAVQATRLKMTFESMLKDYMGEDAEPEQVNTYTIDDYIKIFAGILGTQGANLDLELFFLQTRMFGIGISDDQKKQIENEWKHLKEIECIKQEMRVYHDQELKQKENEIRAEMAMQRDGYVGKIKLLDNEIKELKKGLISAQQTIVKLMNDIKEGQMEIDGKQWFIEEQRKEINDLKRQIVVLQSFMQDLSKKLNENKKEAYEKIQNEWCEENKEKVNKIKDLDHKIAQLYKDIVDLEEKRKQFERVASEWEEHIDTYFSRMDQKIIEHRIESILYQKGYNSAASSQVAATSEYPASVFNLYVQKGYKAEEKEECNDYADYTEIVETNLSNIGDKMPVGMMNDCFNAAINAGLCPLICGYRARELATALVASRYAEKPEIISVPAGYGNTSELAVAIDRAETTAVIVEDVFGRMNEGIIIPILRDSRKKTVVLTAESVEDIMHLQKYYFNYIQLIVADKHTNIKTTNYVYADADKALSGREYTGRGDGHKLARQVFGYIGMDHSYVLTRGNVISELLAEGQNNTEEEALLKLLTTELKWLIKESEKEKLIELFGSSKSKYPEKLIKCIG
ncbi:MAG: hypothetical protein PHC69_02675 [Ruminiclostridium sp.]|nr:hypothetical protein [Ruminiclostridium sp.]